jgi:hypothetical protein
MAPLMHLPPLLLPPVLSADKDLTAASFWSWVTTVLPLDRADELSSCIDDYLREYIKLQPVQSWNKMMTDMHAVITPDSENLDNRFAQLAIHWLLKENREWAPIGRWNILSTYKAVNPAMQLLRYTHTRTHTRARTHTHSFCSGLIVLCVDCVDLLCFAASSTQQGTTSKREPGW